MSKQEESLITDEARAMIGKESQGITGYEVTEHEIRRYCEAVDDLNLLYLDSEEAENGPYKGIIAPPHFHAFPFARQAPLSSFREDGLPGEQAGLMPPLKVTRTMHGGTEIELFTPVRPGDILNTKSKIADIYERKGRSGENIVFTVRETTYTNHRGEIVAIERMTAVSR